MDNSPLLTLFREGYPQFELLYANMADRTLEVVSSDSTVKFSVEERPDEWVVYSERAHSHCETVDEALELLAKLIVGEARSAVRYRGDELAADWIEVKVESHYEALGSALYLNPYDLAEWDLYPGEIWREERVTYLFDPTCGQINSETATRLPKDEEIRRMGLDWLETGLGPPIEGLSWTPGFDYRYIIQKPSGWRMKREENSYVFCSFGQSLILRAWRLYHAPDAEDTVPDKAVRPSKIDRIKKGTRKGWQHIAWNAYFLDNTVVAGLELYFRPEVAKEGEAIGELLDQALGLSLLVPHDWDCHYSPDE